ncbi:MAG: hypothetical protein RL017_719 [Pseudomonadota bacterium]|jgi:magnesium and cobalt transporter
MKILFNYLFKHFIKNHNDFPIVLDLLVENSVIKSDSLSLIEATVNIEYLTAKDIMIPRMSMDVIDIKDSFDSIVNKLIETRHSRFPVIDGEISNIIGIFHSKDLFHQVKHKDEEFVFKDLLRQAYFVPESKHLGDLLHEMKLRQSHMAIVVDQFTNVAGLITLEMIVEQIIGEIEDEHDSVDGERDILLIGINDFRVKGQCKLNKFNLNLKLKWKDVAVETVSGYLIKKLKRTPKTGEILEIDKHKIEIISADSRRINLFRIYK